jgi:predicted ATPase
MNAADLIAERLQALDRRARATVERAALLGYRPDFAILVASGDADPVAAVGALEAACSLDLMVRESWDPPSYRFRHALVQDAIRNAIDADEARAVHVAIAKQLERSADASARLEELAYHWSEGGDAGRSAEYRARAAQDARRLGI